MILDNDAAFLMAQQAADVGNVEQTIYQRRTGEILFCAKGNLSLLRQVLSPNEQLIYVKTIRPSSWPKEEKEDANM